MIYGHVLLVLSIMIIAPVGAGLTLHLLASLQPEYRPLVRSVDRAAHDTLIGSLRVLLVGSMALATALLYVLLLLELVTRGLLRALRAAGRRIGGTPILPMPDSFPLPRLSLLALGRWASRAAPDLPASIWASEPSPGSAAIEERTQGPARRADPTRDDRETIRRRAETDAWPRRRRRARHAPPRAGTSTR